MNALAQGKSGQKGSGAAVAKKVRAKGTAYVVINVEQHDPNYIATLVDIIAVEAVKSGLITVTADAIGKGLADQGQVVLDAILFDFDKATRQPQSKAALDAIVQYLKANPSRNFHVVGHTDSHGTFAYNTKLSSDRARRRRCAGKGLRHCVGPA